MTKKHVENPSKRATVRMPVNELNAQDTIEHYNAVLVEEIRSQVQLVMEIVTNFKSELENKINDLRNEMARRFEIVEGAIMSLKSDIIRIEKCVDNIETIVTCR